MNNQSFCVDHKSTSHIRVQYLLELERFDDAEIEADRFLQKFPKDSTMLGLLCSVYMGKNIPSKALELSDKALCSDPIDISLYRLKSEALASLGYHQSAAETTIVAIALDPLDHLLHQDLGRHRFNLAVESDGVEQVELFSSARDHFIQAIELSPTDVYLHTMLGCVEMGLENWEEAKIQLDIALDIDELSASTHFMKGKLCSQVEDWENAQLHLVRSSQLDQRWAEESNNILKQIKLYAASSPEEDPSIWFDLLLGAKSLLVASVVSILPVVIIWMLVDASIGYIPPLTVAVLSVPALPLAGYIVYRLYRVTGLSLGPSLKTSKQFLTQLETL